MSNWYDDLCEYYSVDPETALKLGTRATGRKPDLPGSKTCKPVSDMTYEDIWESSERSTEESIFQFYRDQGAWATFRQCVRHKDLSQYHLSLISQMLSFCPPRPGFHVCEYGCGVAPFMNTLVNYIRKDNPEIRISISDVDNSEHFIFANWRLKRNIQKRSLDIQLDAKPVRPDELPKYDDLIDLLLIFEVLEHVPSPVLTIKNIYDQLRPGGMVVENFIKHAHSADDDGPDLVSAAKERDEYYNFLNKNFELVIGDSPDKSPNTTRGWRKK